jgi:prevent-host-death family protein
VEKVIPAFDARRQFGRVLNDVVAKGDRFVVERHGEPIAALVPIEVYEQWKRNRAAFFARWKKVAERSILSEQEAMALAKESVTAVRRAKHESSRLFLSARSNMLATLHWLLSRQ